MCGGRNFFYIVINFFYKKNKKLFIINVGIHAVIIYFALCLLICVKFFMQIVIDIESGFLKFVIFKKGISKKIGPGVFKIYKYIFFNI